MHVQLIAVTRYVGPGAPGAEDSERLVERAGRVCYRSAGGRDTSATARFIQRRVDEGHESIIEHASASFEIYGISRACSHQLVRHRIASYSQESQRYVDMADPDWVVPPEIACHPEALGIWEAFCEEARRTYRRLRDMGIRKEDARFLLPNATATRLVMTANFRELLHIFRLRITPHAQWEIRELSVRMLEAVLPHAPSVFGVLRDRLRAEYPSYFADIASGEEPE